MGARIIPSVTLGDFLPPETVVSQRPDENAVDWLPSDPAWMERSSASPLPIVGTLPTVCHAATVTDAGLRLLKVAGHTIPRSILTYRTPAEFRDQILRQVHKENKIYVTYPARTPVCSDGAYRILLPVLRRLNNKANLAELLPSDAVPTRRVLSQAALRSFPDLAVTDRPFVLKASTDLGTGDGVSVIICRSAGDVRRTHTQLATADRVVVEAFHEFTVSWCVHFGIGAAEVRYLSAALQVFDDQGAYLGNWCESSMHDDEVVSNRSACSAGRPAARVSGLPRRRCRLDHRRPLAGSRSELQVQRIDATGPAASVTPGYERDSGVALPPMAYL